MQPSPGHQASKEDDLVDDDNDGVADVDQMAAAELAQHKLEVAMKTVSEPERLQNAFGNLFVAYLAVLATLRLEFARTTAFALGIVEMVRVTAIRALLPMVRRQPSSRSDQRALRPCGRGRAGVAHGRGRADVWCYR